MMNILFRYIYFKNFSIKKLNENFYNIILKGKIDFLNTWKLSLFLFLFCTTETLSSQCFLSDSILIFNVILFTILCWCDVLLCGTVGFFSGNVVGFFDS
jgi:hypothetical protein